MTIVRTPMFLMANLGSEVSRILLFREKGEIDLAKKAHERAIEIINQLSSNPDMEKRLPELNILNDVMEDLWRVDKKYAISSKNLKDYFVPFILLFNRSIK